jgi:hypothetical protein
LSDHTPGGERNARRRSRALVVAFALAVVAAPLAATAAIRAGDSKPPLVRAEGPEPCGAGRSVMPYSRRPALPTARTSKPARLASPRCCTKKARSVVFDVRKLKSVMASGPRTKARQVADADAANTDADAANTDADADAANIDADAANP